jgi:hypothetical protein
MVPLGFQEKMAIRLSFRSRYRTLLLGGLSATICIREGGVKRGFAADFSFSKNGWAGRETASSQ